MHFKRTKTRSERWREKEKKNVIDVQNPSLTAESIFESSTSKQGEEEKTSPKLYQLQHHIYSQDFKKHGMILHNMSFDITSFSTTIDKNNDVFF